jgi:N-acetylmuramoyl-L-alanine amidase
LHYLRNILVMLFGVMLLANCETTQQAPVQSSKGIAFTPQDQACLAEAIYFEAGSTSDAGRRAVGEVILNRATDPRFPPSVCGVVSQRHNGSCQFSYRCDGIPEEYRSAAVRQASEAMAEQLLTARGPDITNGALFFHAAYVRPGWFSTLDERGNFGGNLFYR